MKPDAKELSNKLFRIELNDSRRYDELSGAHYVPSRDKWIPSSTSLDLERARSLMSLLNEYIESKEKEQWLEEIR